MSLARRRRRRGRVLDENILCVSLSESFDRQNTSARELGKYFTTESTFMGVTVYIVCVGVGNGSPAWASQTSDHVQVRHAMLLGWAVSSPQFRVCRLVRMETLCRFYTFFSS